MDFKSFLPNKDKSKKAQLFWSVVIEPKWVQVGIWSVVGSKAKVVASSNPSSWNQSEELISATDAALSSAVQKLDDDSSREPEKTVFGVVSSWVTDGQIDKKYLGQIKHLCSELSLKPAGFVVISEAIANIIKLEEGTAFSGIVLGLSKDYVEISLFKSGNLIETTEVARSISIVEDVVEGISRFKGSEQIPSRIVLYNNKESELEEIRQALLQANWDNFEKPNFLHTPKIEIASPKRKMDAVSLAGAIDIANVTSLKTTVEKDKVVEPKVDESDKNVEEVSPEELGFALNSDVTAFASKSEEKERTTSEVNLDKNVAVVDEPTPIANVKKKSNSIGKFFRNIFSRRKKEKTYTSSTGKKALIWGFVFLVLMLVGGFGLWWYYPKATVTVYLSTTQLEERVTITVDPNASELDLEDGILPGEVLTTKISGSKTTQTTGNKTVGDKATGEVKLFRVGSEISIAADTTITGPGGLEFTLDEAVTVASGSASTPGTANVSVTAKSIGADHNLASGSGFGVDNYSLSDIEAKSESAFSGGSSREIGAVDETDTERLQKELEEELKDKALEELKLVLADLDSCPECMLVEESFSFDNSSLDFSDKVGDEASSLELELTQEVQVLAVNESDLIEFSKRLLDDRVPDGFVLRGDQIDVDFEFEEEIDNTYVLNAFIKVNLFPEVDPSEIASKIKGKYESPVREYLVGKIPGFVRAEIDYKPKLPGKLGTLPHIEKNIEVEIAAER